MPGATLMTRLKVYDSPSVDGQRGGTPHVHLLCSELYFVVSGRGAVEMLDANGFARVELNTHDAFLYSPGSIHRLINPDGNLELFIVMQNSGLPERGDNVVPFPALWLNSDEKFSKAMSAATVEEAHRRRDLGVTGFLELKAAFERSREQGRSALEKFYRQALARTEKVRRGWSEVIENGALAEAKEAFKQLAAMDSGDVSHLMNAQRQLIPAGPFTKAGFCGTLNRYFDAATKLELEGLVTES
jgi:mannose-6-phosphate isomerase-like protein (cupin superfamily)